MSLRVGLGAEDRVVDQAEGLTFGREGDLVIDDDNPYLHRRLGVFTFRGGTWWIGNIGSAVILELSDRASPSKMTITPGAAAPIPFHNSLLRFQAGSLIYELSVQIPKASGITMDIADGGGTSTKTASQVPINHEQRLLLVALAEIRLKDRAAPVSELPTNRQIANRLVWSTTKFNRKLDNLCSKFDRLGVPGLKGDVAGLAVNRRERLVDHVLTAGIVTAADLQILEEHSR